MSNLATGFFVYSDSSNRVRLTKVHVVEPIGCKTLCNLNGIKMNRETYQICANYIVYNYINCKKCKEILNNGKYEICGYDYHHARIIM